MEINEQIIDDNDFRIASKKALLEYLAVQKDERILVLADNTKREIGLNIYSVAQELGFEAFYLEMKEAKFNGEEPDKVVADLMGQFDVVICPTKRSLTHTDARRMACSKGARVATLPGITKEIFVRCLNAESDIIEELSNRLVEKFKDVCFVRVVTKLGTDITMDIRNRRVISSTGIIREEGSGGNLPSGEVYLSPVEGSSNGTIVFDGSVAGIGILEAPMKLSVKDGYVINIITNDNHQAKQLLDTLNEVGKDAFAIAELGIGTNHKAIISGLILEDEKALKTCHIAMGNNKGMGGSIDVPLHIDGIIKNPDIYFDNVMIMQNGDFLF